MLALAEEMWEEEGWFDAHFAMCVISLLSLFFVRALRPMNIITVDFHDQAHKGKKRRPWTKDAR